jgi:hypothetical protein
MMKYPPWKVLTLSGEIVTRERSMDGHLVARTKVPDLTTSPVNA